MGNSAGKENDINNLMHVCIVKDADLPKSVIEENKALVWKLVNERYWELEMNQFDGFEEFNFFRAVNPGFHVGPEQRKAGIFVGNQDMFEKYKDLYDGVYMAWYQQKDGDATDTDGEANDTDLSEGADYCVLIPETRILSVDANNLPDVEDITNVKRLYMKVERNILGMPLLPGVNSVETLKEIEEVLTTAFQALESKFQVDEQSYVSWSSLKKGKMKKLNDAGIGIKPTDAHLKSAGILRWWPQGRGNGCGADVGLKITINEMEHLKVEWTSYFGYIPLKFHTFFKELNKINKILKKKQLGGFWKDPKYGYISADPAKFGKMFYVEVDFTCTAIPTYFTDEEIIKDCEEVLGIAVARATMPYEGVGNLYTLKVLETQWITEDEEYAMLLKTINRLAQIDRSLYYSPKKEGDTLFNLASTRG